MRQRLQVWSFKAPLLLFVTTLLAVLCLLSTNSFISDTQSRPGYYPGRRHSGDAAVAFTRFDTVRLEAESRRCSAETLSSDLFSEETVSSPLHSRPYGSGYVWQNRIYDLAPSPEPDTDADQPHHQQLTAGEKPLGGWSFTRRYTGKAAKNNQPYSLQELRCPWSRMRHMQGANTFKDNHDSNRPGTAFGERKRMTVSTLLTFFIHGNAGDVSQGAYWSCAMSLQVDYARMKKEREQGRPHATNRFAYDDDDDDDEGQKDFASYTFHLAEQSNVHRGRLMGLQADAVADAVQERVGFHQRRSHKKDVHALNGTKTNTTTVADPPVRVWLVGHSMGGIVARTAALLLFQQRIRVEGVLTLNTPHQYPPLFLDRPIAALYDALAMAEAVQLEITHPHIPFDQRPVFTEPLRNSTADTQTKKRESSPLTSRQMVSACGPRGSRSACRQALLPTLKRASPFPARGKEGGSNETLGRRGPSDGVPFFVSLTSGSMDLQIESATTLLPNVLPSRAIMADVVYSKRFFWNTEHPALCGYSRSHDGILEDPCTVSFSAALVLNLASTFTRGPGAGALPFFGQRQNVDRADRFRSDLTSPCRAPLLLSQMNSPSEADDTMKKRDYCSIPSYDWLRMEKTLCLNGRPILTDISLIYGLQQLRRLVALHKGAIRRHPILSTRDIIQLEAPLHSWRSQWGRLLWTRRLWPIATVTLATVLLGSAMWPLLRRSPLWWDLVEKWRRLQRILDDQWGGGQKHRGSGNEALLPLSGAVDGGRRRTEGHSRGLDPRMGYNERAEPSPLTTFWTVTRRCRNCCVGLLLLHYLSVTLGEWWVDPMAHLTSRLLPGQEPSGSYLTNFFPDRLGLFARLKTTCASFVSLVLLSVGPWSVGLVVALAIRGICRVLLACGKLCPREGPTRQDSKKTLPVWSHCCGLCACCRPHLCCRCWKHVSSPRICALIRAAMICGIYLFVQQYLSISSRAFLWCLVSVGILISAGRYTSRVALTPSENQKRDAENVDTTVSVDIPPGAPVSLQHHQSDDSDPSLEAMMLSTYALIFLLQLSPFFTWRNEFISDTFDGPETLDPMQYAVEVGLIILLISYGCVESSAGTQPLRWTSRDDSTIITTTTTTRELLHDVRPRLTTPLMPRGLDSPRRPQVFVAKVIRKSKYLVQHRDLRRHLYLALFAMMLLGMGVSFIHLMWSPVEWSAVLPLMAWMCPVVVLCTKG